MDKKFDVLGKFIENEGKQLTKISDLAKDINPKEIASHIEDDTLGQWCEAWRSAVKFSLNIIESYRMALVIETYEESEDV